MFPPVLRMRDNGDVSAQRATGPPGGLTVQVKLLGPFSVVSGGRVAGPWPRPSARRLCQLVLVSPGRRVSRDLACEELFPGQDPRAAARSVSKALSMARGTLAGLGQPAASLLAADLNHIWAAPAVEVDAEEHERALRAALALEPGHERDGRPRRRSRPRGRTARRRALRGLGAAPEGPAGDPAAGGAAGPGQGPGEGRGRFRAGGGAGRLGSLLRARSRLRGGGRCPGRGLLRARAPGARRARLRALPCRSRRARAGRLPVA